MTETACAMMEQSVLCSIIAHAVSVVKKPPEWAGETATSYFPVGLPPKYRQS